MAKVRFEKTNTPTELPPAGNSWLFIDSADNHLKTIDENGVVVDLTETNNPALTDKLIFSDKTGIEPPHTAGQMYYANGVWNLQDGYPDVTLQVGREQHIEVINNSGNTIFNGSVVRHNGTVNGEIQILLAQADNFVNARILGIAAHDIPNGQKGIITTFGLLNMNTSSLSEGIPLFLSDTVAGGITETPPDIASQVGGVTKSAIDGTLFVSTSSNISLPTVFTGLKGQNSPTYNMTAGNYQAINDYLNKNEVFLTSNLTTGEIDTTKVGAGWYTYNVKFDGTISDEEIDMNFEIYDTVNGIVLDTYNYNCGRGSVPNLVPIAQSFSDDIYIANNNAKLVVRFKVATNETVVFNTMSFSLKTLNVR